MANVGAILAELRRNAGYSQEAFSELLDINPSYLSRVESGHRKPSWRLLVKIAEHLQTPVEDLLRAAGLLAQPAVDEEQVAALISVRPHLAGVFAYVRATGDTKLLADLERFAGWLLTEAGVDESRSGAADRDSE